MDSNNPMKKNIKKIVYVMFENRSFDTMLGWLYDGQPNPIVHSIPPNPEISFQGLTPKLQKTFAQPIKYKVESWDDGYKDIVRGVQGNHFPCFTPLVDPEETFCNINYQLYQNLDATGEPTMLGFLQNYYNHHGGDIGVELEILDTYDNNQLPILNTLAKSYGVSDEWYCSIPSQTSINRAFSICGNSVGNMPTANKGITEETAMVNNHYINDKFLPATFTGKTIWEVLSESKNYQANDWKFYYSSKYIDGLLGTYEYSYSYYLFQGLQDLLKKPGMAENYQPIDQFYTDAKTGALPRFTYLEPKYTNDVIGTVGLHGNDYHPPGDVEWGEAFLASLYNAVKESPDWEDILFIVAWDEHGGTFDHIKPPTTNVVDPCPSVAHECDFNFQRLGVRVPMLFISPWVTENTVIRSQTTSKHFDHTSWLATLLDWFDLDPVLLGARTAVAPKFDAVISDTKRSAVDLPPVWDCKSDDNLLVDKKLSVRKAAEIARVMSAHSTSCDPLTLLRNSLEQATTEKELACFYREWMKHIKNSF